MLGPVVAGLIGVLLPAFGWMPALGMTQLTTDAFADLFAWPGLARASYLSVFVGLAATLFALTVVVMVCACWQGTRAFNWLERVLSPLLSLPHATAAFALAFLIAPSGWIVRLVSPWITGWDSPPDVLVLNDPMGLSLTLGLIVKEIPFLILMTLAALNQINAGPTIRAARSMGYSRHIAWLKLIFPRVYMQIRLPVYVVLAYSMTVVDVATILGPTTPPTLSVQILDWLSDPTLMRHSIAAAGAVWQLGLVAGVLFTWRASERIVASLGTRWIEKGTRGRDSGSLRMLAFALGGGSAFIIGLGLAVLTIWSFAGLWTFPDALPQKFTFKNWERHLPALRDTATETLQIAACASLISLTLSIGCLEAEHRFNLRMRRYSWWLLYIPLIVPQVSFLPGLQMLFLQLGATSGTKAVICAHIVFVLPYVFLSLGDPFRNWDERFATVGASLGHGPDTTLWRLRLPMLLRPILTATAVGFAVSIGQYLPTLLTGGGRVTTLTTEAVALASGSDRRAIGAYGLALTASAMLPFALATLLPRAMWRNRRGLAHG
ncbi:ABC transporter permease subunit (plasmid) [Qingshengfaniella alkalisoli]|uniref:ABC transporter permease subunit n=2 Tax=Qingshengfaniella alkalisoli TaxID=2599296 RepID=A0A5B8J3S1_9RHOB|nr:ABC transporter permease subunit [Qingshengfaniella alkalisoli]QDY71721.1 ABC transporter permease subunit [Qingshengfaniella alkalisoli]